MSVYLLAFCLGATDCTEKTDSVVGLISPKLVMYLLSGTCVSPIFRVTFPAGLVSIVKI